MNITATDIKTFAEDGAVCLRGMFDLSWLNKLAQGLEKNFAAPGPDSSYYTEEGKPGGFYDDYCNWQRVPEYKDFVLHSPAGEAMAHEAFPLAWSAA